MKFDIIIFLYLRENFDKVFIAMFQIKYVGKIHACVLYIQSSTSYEDTCKEVTKALAMTNGRGQSK
jgi:hypothetical protein